MDNTEQKYRLVTHPIGGSQTLTNRIVTLGELALWLDEWMQSDDGQDRFEVEPIYPQPKKIDYEALVQAVRVLHREIPAEPAFYKDDSTKCAHDGQPWPCQEVRLIDGRA